MINKKSKKEYRCQFLNVDPANEEWLYENTIRSECLKSDSALLASEMYINLIDPQHISYFPKDIVVVVNELKSNLSDVECFHFRKKYICDWIVSSLGTEHTIKPDHKTNVNLYKCFFHDNTVANIQAKSHVDAVHKLIQLKGTEYFAFLSSTTHYSKVPELKHAEKTIDVEFITRVLHVHDGRVQFLKAAFDTLEQFILVKEVFKEEK